MSKLQGIITLLATLTALVVAVGGMIKLLPQTKANTDNVQAVAMVSFDRMLSDSIMAYRLARAEAQLARLSISQPTPAQIDSKATDARLAGPMRDTIALRQVRAIARPVRPIGKVKE